MAACSLLVVAAAVAVDWLLHCAAVLVLWLLVANVAGGGCCALLRLLAAGYWLLAQNYCCSGCGSTGWCLRPGCFPLFFFVALAVELPGGCYLHSSLAACAAGYCLQQPG